MSTEKSPLVVLAAGGTGGHVYPAEALASEMLKRGYRLALITDRRGNAYGGVLGELETFRVRAGGVAGKGPFARIQSVFEIALGIWQARAILKRIQPQAVVGFGGYASVPTLVAACLGKYKTAIHEQNAVFGRANRALAPRVDRVITCFEDIEEISEAIRRKTVRCGMPVRAAVFAQRDTPYPDLDGQSPVNVLVLGGSQGARVLSDVVPAAMMALPEPLKARIRITQQCRPEDLERVRAAYKQAGMLAELSSFFNDVPLRMAKSHLVIGRCGASTVAETLVIGRPSILVPYPYAIDDHQMKNAHAVDDAGAGWLMPEKSFTAEALSRRLENLLSIPNTLKKAAACARSVGRPDAAERLAEIVEDLINGRGSNDNGPDNRRQAA
ncbi:MAG: undecaprenyldiphospho-muramoylpentapeptide beta-N-acetylglucosaminyltransferase [Rhodospirillales bacterium]|nr:undecaprenyldiphospho-muramoylpentapeptide beta-N-acetylglucosaminyltransferase [Rhodospirillales bacterium]